jgi:translation elongation factor P/translation initiation factor 5A
MKRIILAAVILIWTGAQVALAGGLSPAAEKDTARPGVVVTDVLEVKATIEAIDSKKRVLTLRGTQGRAITLRADRAVKNFEQLKKGDGILVDFVESVAIFIRPAKAPQSSAEARLVTIAPKGTKTGALLAETFALTAIVESLDIKTRQMTVKEPHGDRWILPVDKSFKNLDRFRKGEEVVLRVTEAIAINVEKRK